MDAVEFVKAIQRDATGKGRDYYSIRTSCNAEKLVSYFEKWAKDHPIKTRQSVFLEQWPEAMIDKTTGVLTICPAELTKECRDDRGACGAYSIEPCVCGPCRHEFWMQEVE